MGGAEEHRESREEGPIKSTGAASNSTYAWILVKVIVLVIWDQHPGKGIVFRLGYMHASQSSLSRLQQAET